MIGNKEDHCSGLKEGGGGKHGHDITQGCFGVGYPDGKIEPVCVREGKRFDEERQAVTIARWDGD